MKWCLDLLILCNLGGLEDDTGNGILDGGSHESHLLHLPFNGTVQVAALTLSLIGHSLLGQLDLHVDQLLHLLLPSLGGGLEQSVALGNGGGDLLVLGQEGGGRLLQGGKSDVVGVGRGLEGLVLDLEVGVFFGDGFG